MKEKEQRYIERENKGEQKQNNKVKMKHPICT
jgi:hypothetical protein